LGAVKRSASEELRMAQATSDMLMARKAFVRWFDDSGTALNEEATF
jgi:hypothetical protein